MSQTILELFEARVNESGPRVSAWRQTERTWESVSWNQWWEEAERISAGIVELGVRPGDRVAILGCTRLDWVIIDIAIMMSGCVSVPIYPSNRPDVVEYVLNDAQCVAVFVDDPSQLDKVATVRGRLGRLKHAIYIDPSVAFERPDWAGRLEVSLDDVRCPRKWALSLDELEVKGRRRISTNHASVASRRKQVSEDDLATIVYTSGTTKDPKGVELTHRNLVSEVRAIRALEILEPTDVQVLFLPLAHIFARVLYLAAIEVGFPTAYLSDLRQLTRTLQEFEPTFFAGVPHVFDTIRTKFIQDSRRSGGLREALFEAAFFQPPEHNAAGRILETAKRRVFQTLFYQRIQEVFGGRIRFMISGGAPLPREIAEFFHAAGLLILEGYGLTEVTAVASVNLPDEFCFGSVGRPLPGVEVTVAEDGEILIRGPSVMRGYRNLPEDTAQAIDANGWLHTGDLGEYDRAGFLHVTGRKKDIMVTAGGKNVSPQLIETLLAASPFITHAIAVGEGRPFISALVILNKPNVLAWAESEGHELTTDINEDPRVRQLVQSQIDQMNTEVASHATIRQFAILEDSFEELAVLTPTNKVRRDVVEDHFRETIDDLYTRK